MALLHTSTTEHYSSMAQPSTSMSQLSSFDLQRECDRLVEHNTTCAHALLVAATGTRLCIIVRRLLRIMSTTCQRVWYEYPF